MRDILFRGKRIDNRKWVEGYYAFIDDARYIYTGALYNVLHVVEERFEIDPSTVGQYIGIPDKNRKKIYEGDIIKRKMFDDYIIGKVVYLDIGFCGFMLKCGNSYYHIGKSEHTGISDCDEVIGNVYENADLLKEAENE